MNIHIMKSITKFRNSLILEHYFDSEIKTTLLSSEIKNSNLNSEI